MNGKTSRRLRYIARLFKLNYPKKIEIRMHFHMDFVEEIGGKKSSVQLICVDQGEITGNVGSGDINGLTGALGKVIAAKLMEKKAFQEELMGMLA